MNLIKSKDELVTTGSFVKEGSSKYGSINAVSSNIKYDLVGKLVDETGLTRKAIIQILQRIDENTFNKFKVNPEEFIINAASLIMMKKQQPL